MNWEKIAWLVFWFTFGFLVFLILYGISVTFISFTSVEFAFLLGFISFLVLGNKLLFGYGWITYLLDKIIKNKEVTFSQKEKLKERLYKRGFNIEEELKEFSFKALLMVALKDLDYYKYSYYAVFLLLTVLTLLAKLDLLGEIVLGKYIEGVFWGAATVTFFIWGLEQLSKVSFVEYNLLDIQEKF